MTKICKKCGDKFPSRKIIGGKVRVLHSRNYCLKCSPYKEGKMGGYGRQTPTIPIHDKKCRICNVTKKSSEFYERKRRGRIELYGRCRACVNDYKLSKDIEKKKRAIEYLGGKCDMCGYKEHYAALVFHHLKDKEYTWHQLRNKSWSDTMKELNKCQLLCSNCHIIIHSKIPAHF